MLEFERHVPSDATDGSPVAVLLHGRGSGPGDLLALASEMPPGTVSVAPRAPYPAAPWGYGPGWAWYRYVASDTVDSETLVGSLDALDGFMGSLADESPVRPGPVFLGGFSQGGCVALSYALSHPGSVRGVFNLSSFLVDDPSVPVNESTARTAPIFWGHGTADPAIPHALAEKGRHRLRSLGADLEARDYPMGHGINLEEMRDLRAWMGRVGKLADAT